ncbi:MAG: FMN-red domain-containing protein [Succiniclasticum sp.]|jgi:multimeric flavodoxin WrbA
MKILFINGSPNSNGHTARLARTMMGSLPYETLNLTEYRINVYGQTLPGDQFGEIVQKMQQADVIVIGSPVYWHNICGSVRTLLDRFYGPVSAGSFRGKKLYFLFQGAAPEKWMLEAGQYTLQRFASLYGFTWGGMATMEKEAAGLLS